MDIGEESRRAREKRYRSEVEASNRRWAQFKREQKQQEERRKADRVRARTYEQPSSDPRIDSILTVCGFFFAVGILIFVLAIIGELTKNL